MKHLFILFFSVMAISMQSCSPKLTEAAQNAPEKKIEVKKGDIFEISLKANASTGFNWSVLKYNKKSLELISNEYKSNADRNMIGAGGEETYKIKALKADQTTIYFQYMRENDTEAKEYKRVTITIK